MIEVLSAEIQFHIVLALDQFWLGVKIPVFGEGRIAGNR